MVPDKIKARGEAMSVLEGHDRLQYIIDGAKNMEPLEDKFKTDENRIYGCVSKLWIIGKALENGTMQYKHDAESFVTKGTAKIVIDLVNGEHKNDVANLTVESFIPLGIKELLTVQRQNGLGNLITRIIELASVKN
jgi:cysteine desulfuration protein SufE|tara:strand:+ start:127 stop:534 length:408 start_codon:yes stop_codon:yes gene_type:complete